jgi:cysteinyl-tRNA synthetase
LQHSDVQTELKLSSQQIQKINQIMRDVREKHKEDFDRLRQLGSEERRRQQADLTKIVSQETMKALRQVLDPGQARRVEQIHLQRQGLGAFADPKVETALGLTADQKNKLKVIGEDVAKEVRMLFRGRAQSNFQEALRKIDKVRSTAVEKGVALLSDEQKKVWQELLGEPFQVKSEQPLIRPPDPPVGTKPASRPGTFA